MSDTLRRVYIIEREREKKRESSVAILLQWTLHLGFSSISIERVVVLYGSVVSHVLCVGRRATLIFRATVYVLVWRFCPCVAQIRNQTEKIDDGGITLCPAIYMYIYKYMCMCLRACILLMGVISGKSNSISIF